MAAKACVRTTDEAAKPRLRGARRFLDAEVWKRAIERRLGPRSWRFLQRATGLMIPMAAGTVLVFLLARGGMPLAAELGGFLPFPLP